MLSRLKVCYKSAVVVLDVETWDFEATVNEFSHNETRF